MKMLELLGLLLLVSVLWVTMWTIIVAIIKFLTK